MHVTMGIMEVTSVELLVCECTATAAVCFEVDNNAQLYTMYNFVQTHHTYIRCNYFNSERIVVPSAPQKHTYST